MTLITEDQIEDQSIEWFEELGYQYLNGYDIAPDGINPERNDFRKSIIKFSKKKSIFGTCAGMIMLSSENKSNNVKPMEIMDFCVNRNAWGRQINSFSDKIKLKFDNQKDFKGAQKMLIKIILVKWQYLAIYLVLFFLQLL